MFTVRIAIECIQNIKLDDFLDGKYNANKEFAVECRDTKTEPLGGWTCYMAQVIHISCKTKIRFLTQAIFINRPTKIYKTCYFLASEEKLEQKLESIAGTRSPRAIPTVDFLSFN